MNWFSGILIVLALLVVNPPTFTYATQPCAFDENGLGTISGRIMGDLRPVAGAEIVLVDNETVIDKLTTDAEGRYSFKYVRPGKYTVKCSKPGHRTSIILQVPAWEDHNTKNDFYLPKFNNDHTTYAVVSDYEDNCRKYMRQK